MPRCLLAITAALVLLPVARAAAIDEGWLISSFEARYTVNTGGTVHVEETIDVDFNSLQKHGIFRDLRNEIPCDPAAADSRSTFTCPSGWYRRYEYGHIRVTDASGRTLQTATTEEGPYRRIRIGDPDRTISGRQVYRISYDIVGALNPFTDHDELYWNVTGPWPAKMMAVTIRVVLPSGGQYSLLACFNGPAGSDERCQATSTDGTATFRNTRALASDEQLTIAAGWPNGLVTVPEPVLRKPQTLWDFFTFDVIELGLSAVLTVLAVAFIPWAWWKYGRDRRYRTLVYLTGDTAEETRPLFAPADVVVEYLPPESLRPAQMGLILDERADTVDVTATIIDLAVRGYVHITEIPKEGWFGSKDWELTRLKGADADLLAYEEHLLTSLFSGRGDEVRLSELRKKFAQDLGEVKSRLYQDAMDRGWFSGRPQTAKLTWVFVGLGVAAAGAGLAYVFGQLVARALLGLPLVAAGAVIAMLSRSMVRRTAVGSEALRRVLGFRLYVDTAETRLHEFNEAQNIFAKYLPFAIVFGSVDKWARAFSGLEEDAARSTAAWYTGAGAFQVASFAHDLGGLSSSVSRSISSTPGGSGGSGGGGSSGGGGGGGGGGSW